MRAEPEVQAKGFDSGKKTVKIIAVALAVVIALVGAIVAFSSKGKNDKSEVSNDSYEDVAKKYAKAKAEFDYKAAFKYAAGDMEQYMEDYFEYISDMQDMTLDEWYEEMEEEYNTKINSVYDVLECQAEETKEEMIDDYGKYKVKVEIVSSKELTELKLKDIIDGDEVLFDYKAVEDYIDTVKIKKGYKVKVKITIDGEDDTDSQTEEYIVVKYKGEWKVYDF